MRCALIVLAGGSSQRMGGSIPKTFLEVCGKMLISYSLDAFEALDVFEKTIFVCPQEYRHLFRKSTCFSNPGYKRQNSVASALSLLDSSFEFVMIHDGARPFIYQSDIKNLLLAGKDHSAVALAGPIRNSMKEVHLTSSEIAVAKTLDRSCVREVYTPQMIRLDIFQKAMNQVLQNNLTITDDLSAVECIGITPYLIESPYFHIKVTYPSDLSIVEAMIQHSSKQKDPFFV